MRKIDEATALAAIWGGAVLGGGGGGDPRAGWAMARAALLSGEVMLATVDEIDPAKTVVTVAMVGSPKAGGMGPEPPHYLDAVRFLARAGNVAPEVLNSNETGGFAVVNGWYQAACLGIPVLDAPCNGRAHPTALMGAMGLHRVEGYVSKQACKGKNLLAYAEGSIQEASSLIRSAAAAEGLVAVARNPVSCGYVREHGAPGAISMAIELGITMAREVRDALGIEPLEPRFVGGLPEDLGTGASRRCQPGLVAAEAVARSLGGRLLPPGTVTGVELNTEGGFDRGWVVVEEADSGNGYRVKIAFVNEYLAATDAAGALLAVYPDLIVLFDVGTGWPVSSADLCRGRTVVPLFCPARNILLGAGAVDKELYEPLLRDLGVPVPGATQDGPGSAQE
ncbi:MAG: DUF917 family protein [Firmicutes bacterium]|nr:DUF917 family protein [Candidatus Fermentithermobacillaceae bacterium]